MPDTFDEALKFENAFQQLVIRLATGFINRPVEQIDAAIVEALREIVEFLGGLRASINEFSEDRSSYHVLYEWSPSDDRRIFPDRLFITSYEDGLPIVEGRPAITITNRDHLPDNSALRKMLAEYGIASVVAVPIVRQDKLIGFISTSWDMPRDIRPEIIDLLRIVSEIFLNAIDRKEIENRVRALNEDLEKRVQERTHELQVTNEQLRNEILERQQIETALRISEERYRIITELISDYAFLYDVEPDGDLNLEWITGDSYARLTGYAVGEIGETFRLYHPEDAELAQQDVERTLQGQPVEREYRIITRSGETRWLYLRRYPLWDIQHKRVERFYGVAQDITERKRTEEALRVSGERYRMVTQLISDCAFLYAIGLDGILKLEWMTEDSYTHLTGYVSGEVGEPLRLYHPDDEQLVQQDIERTIQGQPTYGEYRIMTKSGDVRWVHIRRYPLWDTRRERVERFYGVVQDINERKRTEEALRASEERYRIVSQVISDYAFLCSVALDGSVELEWITEDSYSRLTGYTRDEWGGAFSIYHPQDVQLASQDIQHTLRGESTEREYRIITKSGDARWIYLRRYPLWDAAHEHVARFYGVAQDVTERKRIEEMEHQQRVLAEALLDTADALNSTLDLDEVLDRILANVERVAPHDAGTVYLVESGMARVVRAKSINIPDWKQAVENLSFPIATTATLFHVVETRQPLLIPDVQDYKGWVDVPASRWIRSHISIPIQRGEDVIGVLVCDSATPHFFTQQMLDGLQAFAHQTAVAITNAQLYRQGQELAILQERQRLARDLHDAVTQTIFSATLIAETLPRLWDSSPEEVRQGLTQLRHLTRGALAEMRSLLLELRPEALESTAFPRLMTQLVEAFHGQTGINPSLVIDGERVLPQEVKITFYRITQEALNNISKHAHATEVNVSLTINDIMVRLIVTDNGRGFHPEKVKSGSLGLQIMRERAEKIGANFSVGSEPNIRTTICVEWIEVNG